MEISLLKAIEIENFRGIKKAKIDNLKQITILIGKNGSGKSSILEAIYLVSSCASKVDNVRGVYKINYVVSRRGGRGTWASSHQVLWYLMDTSKVLLIKLHLKDKVNRFLVLHDKLPPTWLLINDGLLDLEKGEYLKSPDTVLSIKAPNELLSELADLKKLLKNIVFIDHTLLSEPKEIEKYAWARVAAKRLDKLIISTIREEFEPEAEGLTYIPMNDEYVLSLQTSRTTVRIDDLGDGVRIAILASLLLLATNPSLLLIEEPENHMHPAGLKSYVKFMFKLAKEKNFQIIASTHSLEFIIIAKEIAKQLGLKLSTIFIERSPEGMVETRNFNLKDTEILSKLGIDPRFLYIY